MSHKFAYRGLKFKVFYRLPLRNCSTAMAEIAAVSALRVCCPCEVGIKPASTAKAISSSENPPSGPIKAIIEWLSLRLSKSFNVQLLSFSQNIIFIVASLAPATIFSKLCVVPMVRGSGRPHCLQDSSIIFCHRSNLADFGGRTAV